jgi:acyl-CoA synthetase (NDP forming)
VHKTEAGAVQLNVSTDGAVRAAFSMVSAVQTAADPSRRPAVIVQPMVRGGVETIVGLLQQPEFGPLVMFGLGGVTTDLLGDRTFRCAPVTDVDAAEMVHAVRAFPLLTGYRGGPPADLATLQEVIVRVGQLGARHPEVAELDLNPVMARPDRAVALDVRVRVAPRAALPDPTLRRLR